MRVTYTTWPSPPPILHAWAIYRDYVFTRVVYSMAHTHLDLRDNEYAVCVEDLGDPSRVPVAHLQCMEDTRMK